MTTVLAEPTKWTFKDGQDPQDPEYRKGLQTPAHIKMDLTLVKDKKRVGTVLNSSSFRQELEEVIDAHVKSSDYPGISTSFLSLQHIVDLFSPAPGKKPSSGGGLVKAQRYNVIPINDLRSGANSYYSRNERLLRCKLASVFRLMDLFGWNTSLNAHVTARVSRDKEHLLINPFGLLFHEVTASSLLKIDSRGNVIDEGSTVLGLKEDSWKLNAYAHAARPDIRVVIHLETAATVAVSVMRTQLAPLCKEAMILGPIAYYDPSEVYARTSASGGDATNESLERSALAEALGPTSKVMFIRSIGLFAMGETIDEAWHYATNAMVSCETQLMLSSLGIENLVIPSQEVCQRTYETWRTADLGGLSRREAAMAMRVTHAAEQKRLRQQQQQIKDKKAASAEPALQGSIPTHTPWRLGELEFEAMMRHLDNAGYRTGHLYRYATLNGDYPEMGPASRATSGQASPRAQSPTPLSTTKGRRSRAQSPAGRSVSSTLASDTEDEVEIPPYTSSVAATMAYFFSDEEDPIGATSGEESDGGPSALRSPGASLGRQRMSGRPWFNTPNSYTKKQLMVFDDSGRAETTNCWISDREAALIGSLKDGVVPPVPAHPLTPGAVPLGATGAGALRPSSTLPQSLSRGTANKTLLNQILPGGTVSCNQFAPQGDNPNEFKNQQKFLKNKYYKDLNSSGPQSRLLDSLTIDEARRLRDETLARALGPRLAAQVSRGGEKAITEKGLVTCASRAIINKSDRSKAIVYDGLYSHVNPFDKITDEELEMYRHEIELKAKSASLDRDFGSTATEVIETERRPYSDGEDTTIRTEPMSSSSGKLLESSLSPQMSPADTSGQEADTSQQKKKKKRRLRFPFFGRKKGKSSDPGPSK